MSVHVAILNQTGHPLGIRERMFVSQERAQTCPSASAVAPTVGETCNAERTGALSTLHKGMWHVAKTHHMGSAFRKQLFCIQSWNFYNTQLYESVCLNCKKKKKRESWSCSSLQQNHNYFLLSCASKDSKFVFCWNLAVFHLAWQHACFVYESSSFKHWLLLIWSDVIRNSAHFLFLKRGIPKPKISQYYSQQQRKIVVKRK